MSNRKIKITDELGIEHYVPIEEIKSSFIVSPDLNKKTLSKIKKIHSKIKDVLKKETPKLSTLEQFELSFMRNINPDLEVNLWEKIIKAYKMAQKIFGEDFEIRCLIFRYLIINIIDGFTKEEKKREDIKAINKIWKEILQNEDFSADLDN